MRLISLHSAPDIPKYLDSLFEIDDLLDHLSFDFQRNLSLNDDREFDEIE